MIPAKLGRDPADFDPTHVVSRFRPFNTLIWQGFPSEEAAMSHIKTMTAAGFTCTLYEVNPRMRYPAGAFAPKSQ